MEIIKVLPKWESGENFQDYSIVHKLSYTENLIMKSYEEGAPKLDLLDLIMAIEATKADNYEYVIAEILSVLYRTSEFGVYEGVHKKVKPYVDKYYRYGIQFVECASFLLFYQKRKDAKNEWRLYGSSMAGGQALISFRV